MRPDVLVALLVVSGCAKPAAVPTPVPSPAAPAVSTPAPLVPVRGEGPPLPASQTVLTRIAFGCCPEPDVDYPVLAAVSLLQPQLFVFVDRIDGSPEQRAETYGQLNLNAQFAAFNMATPIVASPGRAQQVDETAFERYWATAAPGGDRPGVYGSRIFGLPGRRVQLIVLSPQPDPAETAWLESELQRPAEVRLVFGPKVDAVASAQGVTARIFTTDAAYAGPLGASVPPLSGPDAGFGLIEIDWGREQLTLSLRDGSGQVLGSRVQTF